jgi:site-specific DNA-methyltransferase (adenine-specific)
VEEKFPYIEEETGRRFTHEKLEQSSNRKEGDYKRIIQGKVVTVSKGLGWRWTQETFDERLRENPYLIYWTENGKPRYKRYADEYGGRLVTNLWNDVKGLSSNSKERTGYPTQKPLALLERVIKASSKEGDVVLDPFCGCATTCVASEKLGRKWMGIDIEKNAVSVLMKRFDDELGGLITNYIHRTDIPKRTDVEEIEINKNVKERLFKEQEGLCNGCRTEFEIRHFEVDHIVPKAKGGGDYYENYQLLCSSCNRIKGARPMEYLRMKIRAIEEKLRDRFTFGE